VSNQKEQNFENTIELRRSLFRFVVTDEPKRAEL
jgi:hypothetical protein